MADKSPADTVPARLALRSSERPDDIAHVLIGVGQLTMKEWEDRSNAVARGLTERGVRRGCRVVLPCAPRDWLDYAIAYVGTQKAGATAVPVPQQFGSEHVARVARVSNAVGIIGKLEAAPDSVWCADVRELEHGQPPTPMTIDLDTADDAEILFTSGTTGLPKGVVATHENLLYTHSKSRRRSGARQVLHALPPATLATQGLLLQPLDATPHRVITLPRYDDKALFAAIELHRATDVVLVPALALSLIRHAGHQSFDLSGVEIVRTMSAPIAPATLEKLDQLFKNAVIMNMYTTTEAWPARTRIRYSPDHPGSVGRVDRSGSVRIVDSGGRPVDDRSTGNVELALGGAPRRRYLDDNGGSGQVFRSDGWVRTGDTGYLDAEGYLYLVDRNADLVITGGLNVSTIEVEAALLEFPSIVDAAVVGLPHPTLGEYLTAAVQVADGFSNADFSRFLERRLGAVKAPKRIEVVEGLPRNPMGKVLKKELRERFSSRLDDDDVTEPPESALEMQLKRLWSDALGEELTDRRAGFMALGGTSLGALDIIARVRDEIGRDIGQRDIFDSTGLADFARRVEAAPASMTSPREQIQPTARGGLARPALAPNRAASAELPTKYSQDLHYDGTFSGWSNLNVPIVAPLSPGYDPGALELALDDLVVRHESLRTTLVRAGGAVMQQVYEQGALRLEVAESNAAATSAGQHATGIVDLAAYEPFYVRGGWLVRARICRADDTLDVLVVSTHHAVCDGWSAGLLYRDLVELYRARLEGRQARLPGLSLQLGDYASWERSVIRSGPSEFWRERLGGGNPLLELEGLRGSTQAPGRLRVHRVAEVSPAMARRLDGVAAVHETTRVRILAATVIASIREYLQATVTIGFVTANRDRPEILNVVGDLADLVPVRVDLSGDPTFADVIARFHLALEEAYAHRLPYGVLEGLLRDGPDRAAASALDVTVNYVPAAQRGSNKVPDVRHLFRDEDLPWELNAPMFEIDHWWKIGGLLNYTFSARPDGGIDVGIFANITAVSEEQVTELGRRLDLAISQVAAAQLGQLSQP